MIGNCYACKALFTFNPDLVVTIEISGKPRPICKACVEGANKTREGLGQEPIRIHPQAYQDN